MTSGSSGGSAGLSGPSDGHYACRIKEFAFWPRLVLEHEREHISRCMKGKAFLKQAEVDAFLHDLADLDYLISQHEPRVKTP